MLRCFIVAAAALAVSACGPRETGNFYSSPRAYNAPSVAQNFSASDYQSPGGLGRQRHSPTANGGGDVGGDAGASSVPYPNSCGHTRTWNGERCVRGGT